MQLGSKFTVECTVVNGIQLQSVYMSHCNSTSMDTAGLQWCLSEYAIYYKLYYTMISKFCGSPSCQTPCQYRWPITVPVRLQTCVHPSRKYPSVLKHVLRCPDYCCYAYSCLDWKTCSTRLAWPLFHCMKFSKCRVRHDIVCTTRTAG